MYTRAYTQHLTPSLISKYQTVQCLYLFVSYFIYFLRMLNKNKTEIIFPEHNVFIITIFCVLFTLGK